MKNALRNKIVLSLAVALLICISAFAMITFKTEKVQGAPLVSTNIDTAISGKTFEMREGALIRLVEDGDVSTNGMAYQVKIDESAYNSLKNTSGARVTIGMFVAPKEYVDKVDLSVENVFGDNAKYFVDDNKITGEIVENKLEIWHIESAFDTEETIEGCKVFQGSLKNFSNMDAKGLVQRYVGRAYLKYETASGAEYKDAEYANGTAFDNTRSMKKVAELALADTSASALNEGQKALVNKDYMSAFVIADHSDDSKKDFSNYNTADITTTNAWLDNYAGRDGVVKLVSQGANTSGFGNLEFNVDNAMADSMIDAGFTVVKIKLYIELPSVLTGEGTYTISSFNFYPNPTHTVCGNHLDVPVGEWTEITVNAGEFTSASDSSDNKIKQQLTGAKNIYSNQIKWDKDNEGIVIVGNKNAQTITGEDALAATKVTYYIDEIIWDKEYDETAPEITYTGALTTNANEEYEITADVTDDMSTASITGVKMYKGNFATLGEITGEALTLSADNKITLTEAGDYTVVITAKDTANNVAVKLVKVTCVAAVDPNTISELSVAANTSYFTAVEQASMTDGHTSTSSVTYLGSHAEANGVIKVVADNAQGNAAAVGRVKLNLSDEEIEKITNSDCDYVSFRMMIDSAIPYADVKFSFALSEAGIDYVNLNVAKGEWFELKIAKSSLRYNGGATNVTFNVNNIQYKSATQLILKSADGLSTTKMNYYTTSGTNNTANTYGVSAEDLAKYSVITYYIDSIKLGKDGEDNNAPTLLKSGSSTSAFATNATSRSYAAPTFIDDVCYPTVTYRVYSCTSWTDATTYEKGEEITVYGQAACTSVVTSGVTMYFSANDFTTSSREIIIEYSVSDKAGNVLNVAQKVTVTNNNIA